MCSTLEVGGPDKLPFHKWWQLKRPAVLSLWSSLGVSESEHVPSLRSGQGSPEEARDVPSMSSQGIAALPAPLRRVRQYVQRRTEHELGLHCLDGLLVASLLQK